MKFLIWQETEEKNRENTSFRLQVMNVDGRSLEKVEQITQEFGWKQIGQMFPQIGITLVYSRIYKDVNEAKKHCQKFPYEVFFVDRKNKETRWNCKQKRGRPQKVSK